MIFMFYDITLDFGGVNFPKPYKRPDTTYIGFVSVFSGCSRAMMGSPCPDCQNPSLWSWDCKSRFESMNDVTSFVHKKASLFNMITAGKEVQYFYAVLGGEPLDQDAVALSVVHQAVRFGISCDIPTVLFTGYPSLNDIRIHPNVRRYVTDNIDYLKVGSYLGDAYKVEDLESGLATSNQYWVRISSVA